MNVIRIIYLLRGYFIEHKKMLLLCSLIVFAAAILDATFSYSIELSAFAACFISFWVAGIFFQPLLKKDNSTFLLNLPVSAGERLFNAVVLIAIFGIIVQTLFVIGIYTGYFGIRPLLNPDAESLYARGFAIFEFRWGYYLYYFAILFAFLFGSIYFKKNAFWLSAVSGMGIILGIVLYQFALLFITFGTTKPTFSYTICIPPDSAFLNTHFYITPIALILFFISLTYLRLKETEV